MFGSGTGDATGTTWNMTADMADPQTGKMAPTRIVTKTVDADHDDGHVRTGTGRQGNEDDVDRGDAFE